MNCPHCGKEINVGALIGSVSTAAKAAAARENGKLGGRPRKPKRVARRANGRSKPRLNEQNGYLMVKGVSGSQGQVAMGFTATSRFARSSGDTSARFRFIAAA